MWPQGAIAPLTLVDGAPQLDYPRLTTGTVAASGSASKNSRLVKPNGPAIKTFGNVWSELLNSSTVAL